MAQSSAAQGLTGVCGGFFQTAGISFACILSGIIIMTVLSGAVIGYCLYEIGCLYLIVVLAQTRKATRVKLGIADEEFKVRLDEGAPGAVVYSNNPDTLLS